MVIIEGSFDVKLVGGVELYGPILVILRGIHCAIGLLEVELLRGEYDFHKFNEGRLACVTRPTHPHKALLRILTRCEKYFRTCFEKAKVS